MSPPAVSRRQVLNEAIMDLRCISDIMAVLGENAMQDDGVIPASWMIWLSACLKEETQKALDALAALDKPVRS